MLKFRFIYNILAKRFICVNQNGLINNYSNFNIKIAIHHYEPHFHFSSIKLIGSDREPDTFKKASASKIKKSYRRNRIWTNSCCEMTSTLLRLQRKISSNQPVSLIFYFFLISLSHTTWRSQNQKEKITTKRNRNEKKLP